MLIAKCGHLLLSVFVTVLLSLILVNVCVLVYVCLRICFYACACAHIHRNINICYILIVYVRPRGRHNHCSPGYRFRFCNVFNGVCSLCNWVVICNVISMNLHKKKKKKKERIKKASMQYHFQSHTIIEKIVTFRFVFRGRNWLLWERLQKTSHRLKSEKTAKSKSHMINLNLHRKYHLFKLVKEDLCKSDETTTLAGVSGGKKIKIFVRYLTLVFNYISLSLRKQKLQFYKIHNITNLRCLSVLNSFFGICYYFFRKTSIVGHFNVSLLIGTRG